MGSFAGDPKLCDRLRLWELSDRVVFEPIDAPSCQFLSIDREDGLLQWISMFVISSFKFRTGESAETRRCCTYSPHSPHALYRDVDIRAQGMDFINVSFHADVRACLASSVHSAVGSALRNSLCVQYKFVLISSSKHGVGFYFSSEVGWV